MDTTNSEIKLMIPSSAVENFKCSECFHFLSVGPIRMKLDGKNICGRCYIYVPEETQLIRNYAYEAAASAYLFPCIYKMFGCPSYVNFNDSVQHETFCCYRVYQCPVSTGCMWSGNIKQLPEHYVEAHPELYVRRFSFTFILENDVMESYLLHNQGLYSVLQVEWKDKSLRCNVISLEDPSDAEFIKYSVEIQGSSTKNFVKLEQQPVLSRNYLAINAIKSKEINLAGLLEILKCNESVIFNFMIYIDKTYELKLNCPVCGHILAPPIYRCTVFNHILCADCKGFEMDCTRCNEVNVVSKLVRERDFEKSTENHKFSCRWAGCNYKSKGIREHERECIMRVYKCPERACIDEWSGPLNNMIEHLKTSHSHMKFHVSCDGTFAASYRIGAFEYIIAHKEVFLCHFGYSENEGGMLQIYFKGRPSEASNFRYELEVINSEGLSEIYELSRFLKNRYEVQVPFSPNDTHTKYMINIIKVSKTYLQMCNRLEC